MPCVSRIRLFTRGRTKCGRDARAIRALCRSDFPIPAASPGDSPVGMRTQITGQQLLGGMGELHLQIVAER